MIDSANKVGYMKLDQFTQSSSADMDKALWKLYRQGMKSLVLDLRGNPGGLLTSAIDLSNKFLPCGTIVSTRGRTVADNTKESATRQKTWKLPLVVLVDGNSASASEILAAAIQENDRGTVVGRRSYGKGTVQTQFPMRSMSASIRLTTARFYSPDDRQMAGAGVTPDVLVEKSDAEGADADLAKAIEVATQKGTADLAVAKGNCRDHAHGSNSANGFRLQS